LPPENDWDKDFLPTLGGSWLLLPPWGKVGKGVNIIGEGRAGGKHNSGRPVRELERPMCIGKSWCPFLKNHKTGSKILRNFLS